MVLKMFAGATFRFFVTVCAVVEISSALNENVLELVHVIFRHGSRSPEKSEVYPTDPHATAKFYPFGYGQLTNIGKKRSYQLGSLLRARYESFLGNHYTPEIVFTKTTDYVRTQMSALLVLAGLFPPSKEQKWNDDLNWMPIPYSYDKKMQDYELRRPDLYCPVLNYEIDEKLKSEPVLNLLKEHQKQIIYMSQHSGKNITGVKDIFFLYQGLHAEHLMNLTLPEWTNSIFPEPLHELAVRFLTYANDSPLTKRLNAGRLFKKVLDNIIARSKGLLKPEETKMFLYSGHEVNVINALTILGLFDNKFPEFSSAVMIELYSNPTSKQYTVKVVYARDVYNQPEEMVIPGCTEFCPLTELIELVKQFLPNNYTEECGSLVPLD